MEQLSLAREPAFWNSRQSGGTADSRETGRGFGETGRCRIDRVYKL